MNARVPLSTLVSTPLSTQPFSKWFEVHPGLGISMMDHLFNRLDGAYPHKWRSAFPNQQAIDNFCESWAEAFEEEGITPNDIKAGLKVCRNRYDWPPSCAEFVKACKPSVDPLVAYYEAAAGVQAREKGEHGTWSHPAIFWASAGLAYDLKHQTYSQIKDRWNKALQDEMDKGAWPDVPAPMLALPEPGKSELSREHATRMVQELGAGDVLKPKTDHLLWMRRILDREKRGDKTLTSLQVNFAKEAAKNVGMQ